MCAISLIFISTNIIPAARESYSQNRTTNTESDMSGTPFGISANPEGEKMAIAHRLVRLRCDFRWICGRRCKDGTATRQSDTVRQDSRKFGLRGCRIRQHRGPNLYTQFLAAITRSNDQKVSNAWVSTHVLTIPQQLAKLRKYGGKKAVIGEARSPKF